MRTREGFIKRMNIREKTELVGKTFTWLYHQETEGGTILIGRFIKKLSVRELKELISFQPASK